jgi:uncharacterized protein YndB with AHSA1/START domain
MTLTPTAQLTAVTRTVSPAPRGNAVVLSQTFEAAPEQVWEALTSAERLARWFGTARGEVVPGGRYALPEMETEGRLVEVDPPHRLVLTWEYGKSSSDLELLLATAEEGGGTTFTLRHTVPADAHWATFGPGATGCGWDGALLGLAEHLRDPGADLLPRLAAFAGSPEGAEFTRATAEAWYEAHVAGGADRKPARKASVRTVAAYLDEEIDLP